MHLSNKQQTSGAEQASSHSLSIVTISQFYSSALQNRRAAHKSYMHIYVFNWGLKPIIQLFFVKDNKHSVKALKQLWWSILFMKKRLCFKSDINGKQMVPSVGISLKCSIFGVY